MVGILRRKFIIISVSAVFAVVLIIGLLSNIFNYSKINKNTDELLQIISENDGYFPRQNPSNSQDILLPKISPEAPFSTRFFTIKVDANENLIEVDTGKIFSVTTDIALTYANRVLQSNKTSGFVDDYKYIITSKDYGSLLVFIDVRRELQIFYSFLHSSILIGLIGVFTVFIIVLVFSKRAIAPVAESYKKQKQFITDAGNPDTKINPDKQ